MREMRCSSTCVPRLPYWRREYCDAERSEVSWRPTREALRCAQGDTRGRSGWQDAKGGLSLLLFPLSLGFAILRYCLWDIDVLVNRTLATFSATLRNEVDLNQLREDLLGVVQETMQPAHISLWLRKPDYERKSHADG